MTQPTPAETLRAAAVKLWNATSAIRDEIKTNTYWHGVPVEEAWARGAANGLGGPAGDYAALWGPDVADALAYWLDSAAEDAEQIGPDPHALAVARAILGEVTE